MAFPAGHVETETNFLGQCLSMSENFRKFGHKKTFGGNGVAVLLLELKVDDF